jgi:hypothetical protein
METVRPMGKGNIRDRTAISKANRSGFRSRYVRVGGTRILLEDQRGGTNQRRDNRWNQEIGVRPTLSKPQRKGIRGIQEKTLDK